MTGSRATLVTTFTYEANANSWAEPGYFDFSAARREEPVSFGLIMPDHEAITIVDVDQLRDNIIRGLEVIGVSGRLPRAIPEAVTPPGVQLRTPIPQGEVWDIPLEDLDFDPPRSGAVQIPVSFHVHPTSAHHLARLVLHFQDGETAHSFRLKPNTRRPVGLSAECEEGPNDELLRVIIEGRFQLPEGALVDITSA